MPERKQFFYRRASLRPIWNFSRSFIFSGGCRLPLLLYIGILEQRKLSQPRYIQIHMDGSTSVKREWVLSIEKWKLKNKFHLFFLRSVSEITRPKIGLKWCASCAVSRSLTPNTPAPSLKELYLDTNRPPWETKSQYSPLMLQSLPNPTEPLSMGSNLDLTPQFISAPNPSDLDRNEPLSLSSEPVPMKLFKTTIEAKLIEEKGV